MGAVLSQQSSDTIGNGNLPSRSFGNLFVTPDTSTPSTVVPTSDGSILVSNVVIGATVGSVAIKPNITSISALEFSIISGTTVQYLVSQMKVGVVPVTNQNYIQIYFASAFTSVDLRSSVEDRLVQVFEFVDDQSTISNVPFRFASIGPGGSCLQVSTQLVNISIPYSPTQLIQILENSTASKTTVVVTMYLTQSSSNGTILTLQSLNLLKTSISIKTY